MFKAIKKHLAIRSYRNKLGPWLERQFGWRAHYAPDQVRSGVSSLHISSDFSCFAYAMYCTRSDFDAHHAATGEACDYDSMHAEISTIDSAGDSGSHGSDSGGGWFDSSGDSGDCGGDGGGGDGGGGD